MQASAPLSLPRSLARLNKLLSDAILAQGSLTPRQAQDLVEQADVNETDLGAYADFSHALQDGYGRKLVLDNGQFEIMVMSWNPGDYSSIHDHGHTQWGVVKTFGNVHHLVYCDKGDELTFVKREILAKGSLTKVSNATIHQMGNPSTTPYLTLHIYGANGRDGAITADARNFELEFDRVNHTTGGAFFNLPSEQIYDLASAPKASNDVLLHYAKLLLDYYERLEQTPEIKTLKAQLLNKVTQQLCD